MEYTHTTTEVTNKGGMVDTFCMTLAILFLAISAVLIYLQSEKLPSSLIWECCVVFYGLCKEKIRSIFVS